MVVAIATVSSAGACGPAAEWSLWRNGLFFFFFFLPCTLCNEISQKESTDGTAGKTQIWVIISLLKLTLTTEKLSSAEVMNSPPEAWLIEHSDRMFVLSHKHKIKSKEAHGRRRDAGFVTCAGWQTLQALVCCSHPVRCPHGEMNLSNYSLPNQAVLVPLLLRRYSTV